MTLTLFELQGTRNQNVNYNTELVKIAKSFFFFLWSFLILFSVSPWKINCMSRIYLRTQCVGRLPWHPFMSLTHLTVVWPLVYGCDSWHDVPLARKWTGCDLVIMNGLLCVIRITAHTHTWTSSYTPQIQLWRQFCRLHDGEDQTMTHWTSALPSLKVISCKACWKIDWSEDPTNLALLWPSTGKNKGSINCAGTPYRRWVSQNNMVSWRPISH